LFDPRLRFKDVLKVFQWIDYFQTADGETEYYLTHGNAKPINDEDVDL
jgi:hypothetical protein